MSIMAGRGRRRTEYRMLKDREKEKKRHNFLRMLAEGFDHLEEMDEVLSEKRALVERLDRAVALEPGEQREGEPLIHALWRREMRERYGIDEKMLMIEEIGIIGRDVRGMVDAEGKMLGLHQMDEILARNIRGVKVRELRDGTVTWEYTLEDRGKALERMEKMMGMYEGEGNMKEAMGGVDEGFAERLRRARERVERFHLREAEEVKDSTPAPARDYEGGGGI